MGGHGQRVRHADRPRAPLRPAAELSQRLDAACESEGRDPATIDRLVLGGFGSLRDMDSVAAFEDAVGRLAELGFTDVVIHHPRPAEPFAYRLDLLERIAVEVLPRLA